MKIVLLENLRKLGSIGEIINVKRGYARNYGAHKARGRYLNFFDSDDIVLQNQFDTNSLLEPKQEYRKYFSKLINETKILIKSAIQFAGLT